MNCTETVLITNFVDMGNESECMISNLAISENWLVQVKVIES